jgi:glycosyltransferase involved in cell wall biosynthesis
VGCLHRVATQSGRATTLLDQNTRLTVVTSSFPVAPDQLHAQAPFLAEFLDELCDQGVDVTVFTQAQAGAVDDVLPRVRVIRFPWAQAARALALMNPLNPVDAWRLTSYLVQGRRHLLAHLQADLPHAVLALWAIPSGWLALQGRNRLGIPFGVWCLGSDIHRPSRHALGRAVLRQVLKAATWLWADGFGLADEVSALAGAPCTYLATARRLPQAPACPRDESSTGPRWLFVGRLERVKGIDVLVDAMIEYLKCGGPGRLTIAGDGSLRESMAVRALSAGAGDRIQFAGSVSDEELAALYAAADCVVIPSRSESLPLVFGEALAAGKRLVVTDVGDMGRLGREHRVARVVPPGDSAALARVLEETTQVPQSVDPSGRLALLDQLNVRRSAREVASAVRTMSEPRIPL